jgi:gamma-glutamylcyclotransferase (GGCT)/AIG2-like uncharacterized protein YtfP
MKSLFRLLPSIFGNEEEEIAKPLKETIMSDDQIKPRSYRYSWTPGSRTFEKEEIKPDKATENKTAAALSRFSNFGYNPPTKSYDYRDYAQAYVAPKKEEIKFIFIYDSSPGNLTEAIMRRDGFIKKIKTEPKFRLYDLGDFPGMASNGTTAISGELYPAVPRTIKFLDATRDTRGPFRKEAVTLEDGTRAWAYLLGAHKVPGHEALITSGSWVEWQKGKRERTRAAKAAALLAQKAKDNAFQEWKRGVTSGIDPETGKRRVHISELNTIEIRLMMRDHGFDEERMNDREVRVEAIKTYGPWYLIDA